MTRASSEKLNYEYNAGDEKMIKHIRRSSVRRVYIVDERGNRIYANNAAAVNAAREVSKFKRFTQWVKNLGLKKLKD